MADSKATVNVLDAPQISTKLREYIHAVGGEEYMDEAGFLEFLFDDKLEPLAFVTKRRVKAAFEPAVVEYLVKN